jgi:hypothetical protein
MVSITRLSGGLTPANGADPRTFPAIWNTTADTIEGLDLNDLADVTAPSPTTGQILEWNGTAWVNGQVDAAGIASNAVTTAKILNANVTADKLASNSVTTAKIADANVTSAKLGTGTILQVVQTVFTGVFNQVNVAVGAFTNQVTNLDTTITPRATSSKVLVMFSVSTGSSSAHDIGVRLLKGGSPVTAYIGDQLGTNRRRVSVMSDGSANPTNVSGTYLDSPNTTSAITYSVDLFHDRDQTANNIYVNRSSAGDNTQTATAASTITLMEVAG